MTAKELRPHNEEQKDEGVQHERCPAATFYGRALADFR